MNELQIYNSTNIIAQTTSETLNLRAAQFGELKEFLRRELKDGVDFGLIPGTDKPTLFKAGGEKIQMLLGITPIYKLLNRTFEKQIDVESVEWNEAAKKRETVITHRNFYSWEFSCELYYGEHKIAEGVGCANTEEDKYVSQYKGKKTSDSVANTVMKIAKKRAFMDAVLGVAGISDMYTADLEDNETINKLKWNKTEPGTKIKKENIKTIYATAGVLNITTKDIDSILLDLGYNSIKEADNDKANIIIEEIKKLAKARKEA